MNREMVGSADEPHLRLSPGRTGVRKAGWAAFAAACLLLSGCTGGGESAPGTTGSEPPAASSDAKASAPPAGDASAGEATLSIGGREFTVELTTCGVYDGGGEVVLSGHAVEVGGAVSGFFDGDLTTLDSRVYGEFRLDIGATGPFESSDEFLALGDPVGGEIAFSEEAHGNVITAKAWNEEGDDLGEGSLTFVC